MQTLYKKIENLEKAAVPVLRARQRIAEQALCRSFRPGIPDQRFWRRPGGPQSYRIRIRIQASL